MSAPATREWLIGREAGLRAAVGLLREQLLDDLDDYLSTPGGAKAGLRRLGELVERLETVADDCAEDRAGLPW